MFSKGLRISSSKDGPPLIHLVVLSAALTGAWQLWADTPYKSLNNNDLSSISRPSIISSMEPLTGSIDFQATAYCESGITRSGVPTAPGIAAADPRVLPLGSLVLVENENYRGLLRIMDTGRLVKGRIVDIFMTEFDKAVEFGRKPVKLVVLRYGEQPRAAPGGKTLRLIR